MTTIPISTNTGNRIPAKTTPKNERPEGVEHVGVSAVKAAAMIGVCERTIWKLAKVGAIRSVRIGTRCIFSVQSLRELVDGKEPAKNAENAPES